MKTAETSPHVLGQKNDAVRFQIEGQGLHLWKKKTVGTELIFDTFGPFFYGTGKTGTGQVSFTQKNSSKPFQFLSECHLVHSGTL